MITIFHSFCMFDDLCVELILSHFYIRCFVAGVLLPHATVLNRLQWQWRELPYATDEEHCVFKTSLTFVDSVSEIWGPLLQGRTLVVVPKHVTRDPERFVTVLEKYKVRIIVNIMIKVDFLRIYYLRKRINKKEIRDYSRFERIHYV